MSLNLNHVVLAGHLTRDPEVRQIGDDKVVAKTGVAINRRWKDAAGEQREEATFVEIEAWGRTAELMGQYLKKGSPAYIEGRLKLDTWEDKESGEKRSKMKVVADTVQFLASRPAGEHGEATDNATEGAVGRPARQPAPARARPAPAKARVPVPEGEAPF